MALVEIYHVVADFYEIDSRNKTDFIEGMAGMLQEDGAGKVFVTGATGATDTFCIGVLGDSKDQDTGNTPFSSDLVIGAHAPVSNPVAKTRSTSNRVSDFFDETKGSGRMTVYHSGGKFATDQYETVAAGVPLDYNGGDRLFVSANHKFTKAQSPNGEIVAIVAEAPKAWPSGVPGTDTPDGSLSLGSFITLILRV